MVLKAVPLCFVFSMCLIAFSLFATTQKILRLGLLMPSRIPFENLLDETSLKKRKKKSLALTRVTF